MKFWQKIFISSIILFVIVFNVGAYFIVSYSYEFTLQREKESSIREQTVILSSINTSIKNYEKALPGAPRDLIILSSIIKPLAEYYSSQNVSLALYKDDKLVYSSAPAIDAELLKNNGSTKIYNTKVEDKRYLFISSGITDFKNLTFVYVRDISLVDAYKRKVSQFFARISVIVILALSIAYYFIIKNHTNPIKRLNMATKKISNGAFNERVNIKRNDELGELSNTFNAMADSIEEKISELISQAEKRQQFIDNLAHEMKTPLTSILGYSEFLQNAMSSEEERIKAASYIHRSAKQLSILSTQLLDMAFLSNDELKLSELKVKDLLDALKNIVMPLLQHKHLCLKISNELEIIRGNESLILSLLTNLVENAIKASEETETIEIKVFANKNPVFEIIDYGCGMTNDELSKILDPFYRVDKSRSKESGGAGLGLSIVKKIADLHNAKIEISSQVGIGTKVRVTFYNSLTT